MINNDFDSSIFWTDNSVDENPSPQLSPIDVGVYFFSIEVFSGMTFECSEIETTEESEEAASESESEAEAIEVEDFTERIDIEVCSSDSPSEFGQLDLNFSSADQKDFLLNFYVLFDITQEKSGQLSGWIKQNAVSMKVNFEGSYSADYLFSKAAELYQEMDFPCFFISAKKDMKKRFKEVVSKKEKQAMKIINYRMS